MDNDYHDHLCAPMSLTTAFSPSELSINTVLDQLGGTSTDVDSSLWPPNVAQQSSDCSLNIACGPEQDKPKKYDIHIGTESGSSIGFCSADDIQREFCRRALAVNSNMLGSQLRMEQLESDDSGTYFQIEYTSSDGSSFSNDVLHRDRLQQCAPGTVTLSLSKKSASSREGSGLFQDVSKNNYNNLTPDSIRISSNT